ncbi:MAG TPA: flagellar biosynthetic protein FliO [Nocardioides sp.]
MLELTVRLVFSLAVVIGLLLLIAKFSARRFKSNGGATIQVIHRQALTRSSAVSVVSVGGRVLVLGSTEQQINLLAELDPDELELDVVEPVPGDGDSDDYRDDGSGDDLEPSVGLTILDSPRTVEVPDGWSRASARSALAQQGTSEQRVVRRGAHKAPGARKAPRVPQDGALAGSILSVGTWRQAVAAVRRAS